VPTQEQLKSFDLKPGKNNITFLVERKPKESRFVNGYIYLWDHTSRIVISDVDGTITKSDVMGHIMTFFGKDWSHPNLAELF